MKKILVSLFLAAAAMNVSAQLVVDTLGHVGIGVDTVKSVFAVGSKGDEYITMYCSGKDDEYEYGFYFENHTDAECGIFGGMVYANNALYNCYGEIGLALGGGGSNTQHKAVGLCGFANRSHTSAGVLGGKWVGNYNPVNFAGVYGSETFDLSPNFTSYSGIYAGFFRGKVRVTNGIYATVLSPATSPSPSGEGGATILSDRGESVTDKLSQVQALQFLRYDPTKESTTAKASVSSLEELDIDNMPPRQLDSLARTVGQAEPERYLSPIQYGLAADQLKAVYPELVYEDANGNVSVNYVEMIPLLVQSIKELKSELAELKGTAPKKSKAQPTAIDEIVSDVDMVRMDQNKPNPFSESTVITLNIPQQAQTASIFIYDMSGKQVQSISVSERSETNITVYASDLTAGMYIYTFVVDGKVVVTRRMIVEK